MCVHTEHIWMSMRTCVERATTQNPAIMRLGFLLIGLLVPLWQDVEDFRKRLHFVHVELDQPGPEF